MRRCAGRRRWGGRRRRRRGRRRRRKRRRRRGGAEAQGEAQAEAGSALSLQSAVSNLTERALDNVTEELKKKLTPALLARLGGKLLCGGKGSLGGGSGAVASRHERSVVNIDAQRRALCYDVMLPPAVRLALQNNVVVKRMVDNVGSVTGEDLVSWCKYLREEYGKKLNMEKLKTVNLWRVILIDRLLLQMLAEGVIVGVNELEGERAGEVTRMLRPGRMWEVAYNRCVEFNAAFRLLQREMFEGKARYAHTVTPCKEVLDALGMGPPPTAPKEASKWRGPSESDPAMHCNEAGEWRIMPQLRDGLYYTRFEYREEKFEANANILFDDAPHRMKRQRELSGVLGGERGGQKRPRVSPGAPAGVSGGPPAYALERLAAVCAGEMRGGAGA